MSAASDFRVWVFILAAALCLVRPTRADADDARDAVASLRVRARVVVDREAWKWNWASWDQEKIVTFGPFQYTPYWDADRVFVLARRDLRTGEVQTLRLPQFRLSSDDRHRNTCLGVSPADGRLHLSWDHHNNPLRYAKSRAGFLTDPPSRLSVDDIEPGAPMLPDAKLEARVTYPRFLNDREGTLLLVYRIGGSGNGDLFLHRYEPADASWSRVGMLFSSRGTYPLWRNSTSRCAYLHDLVFDREGRLHASWVYRETGASWASNHDLHYATSDDQGVTWHNNTGRPIADLAQGDPIALDDPGIVVREIPVYSWLMNAGCLALDSKSRPHVVTFRSRIEHKPERLQHGPPPEIEKEIRFVHFWRADDGTWHGGEPIEPGPARRSRVDVVFDRADNLYFYYPSEAGFRYFTAPARDRWQRWSGPLVLTGPELTGRDASKHDRRRWSEERILSFTAKAAPQGFAIVDVEMAEE